MQEKLTPQRQRRRPRARGEGACHLERSDLAFLAVLEVLEVTAGAGEMVKCLLLLCGCEALDLVP